MPLAASPSTTLSPAELWRTFDTNANGLSDREAQSRLKRYGPNTLRSHEPSAWQLLVRQFSSPFIYLLFAAAVISFGLKQFTEGWMILLFVAINSSLGFSQEYHSQRVLRALAHYVGATARVRRHGVEQALPSHDLVRGDVVIIETGDVIPADLRLLEENDLLADESSLTGESAPVKKISAALPKAAQDVYHATNIAFSGTTVVSGKGLGVVIATGSATLMGEITSLAVETQRESRFEKGLAEFSRVILRLILVTMTLVFVAHLLIKGLSAPVWELLLFSVVLTISVIPEALPVVTTISLARGALKLAKSKVVVKRLSAIEDLGSLQVLCTDKTGTITKNQLTIADVKAEDRARCLHFGALASSFLGETKPQPNNAFDVALWQSLSATEQHHARQTPRLHEIPFDPERRRNSVLVKEKTGQMLIVRGAPEAVFSVCEKSSTLATTHATWIRTQGHQGRRVLAVAVKPCGDSQTYTSKDEHASFQLVGLIAFEDPVKPTASHAIERARHLGLQVKILTGDGPEVAIAVAHEIGLVEAGSPAMTGEAFEKLTPTEQRRAAENHAVFARVSPRQKYAIIQRLQERFEVGFLGEGINDAPALKLADVGLVVQGASDVAREAADIVLLQQSLDVIVSGIHEGREIFANTLKFIKITLASNFGNFYSVAIASLFINFLPLLPLQILLLNLLSDFPMMAIATDRLDPGELARPKTYDLKEIIVFTTVLGLVSSVFDFIFFRLFFHASPGALQTNWFIESILTELVFVFSVRTRLPFWKAKRPSMSLLVLSVGAGMATLILPFSRLGQTLFHFLAPTPVALGLTLSIVVMYFFTTEAVKRFLLFRSRGLQRCL